MSCDYTVHPRWLTDNNDGTELWPDNLPRQSSQDEMEMVQDEVVIEEPAPIDFDWCEETSNCGDLILEQDIPATLEEEVVTNSGTEAEDDIFYEPTPTIPIAYKQMPSTSTVPSVVKSPNPRSLLKSSYLYEIERPPTKFRKTLVVNRSLLKSNHIDSKAQLEKDSRPKSPVIETKRIINTIEPKPQPVPVPISRTLKEAPKFRQSIKLVHKGIMQSKNLRHLTKKLRQRTHGTGKKSDRPKVNKETVIKAAPVSNTSNYGKGKGKGKRGKKFLDMHGENITINHDVESGSTLDPRKRCESSVSEDTDIVSGLNYIINIVYF